MRYFAPALAKPLFGKCNQRMLRWNNKNNY